MSAIMFNILAISILCVISQAATYVRDPSFNTTISTFYIGEGMYPSPRDSTLFFVGRTTEGGPYQLYEISMNKSNEILNEWKSGDWSEPESIEVIYYSSSNSTKLWIADQGLAVLSQFDVDSGKVDGHIGIENNQGTNTDPIQFTTPGSISFAPDKTKESEYRILLFGDDQPFEPCHRFGKLNVSNTVDDNGEFPTETIFVVGTNGTVDTDIKFEDITTIAYDVQRDWLWLNDYLQYQVFVYDGTDGKYVGTWPCNAGTANGGVYFDRTRNIFWQVLGGKIEAFDVSPLSNADDLNSFDCKKQSIYSEVIRGQEGDPTALAVNSKNGDVYVAVSRYDIQKGASIYRYNYQS